VKSDLLLNAFAWHKNLKPADQRFIMRIETPMKGETKEERCVICKGKISKTFAQRNENICEKCWYKLSKENPVE